jgi:hypothetical protein
MSAVGELNGLSESSRSRPATPGQEHQLGVIGKIGTVKSGGMAGSERIDRRQAAYFVEKLSKN